jgi:autophagy-related protein 9
MWEKLNNSSLIFSKTFVENNSDYSTYSNRVFFHRIYFYYNNKGYYNIIINSIINLLVSNFLVFFLIFLINCVDYTNLLRIDDKVSILDYVDMSNFFSNLSIFFKGLLILFLALDVVKLISLVDDIYVFKNIRNFYRNTLKIRDSELEYLDWKDIIDIYNDADENINPYYINAIITSKDNYFTALIDQKIIRPIHLTSIVEWNLIYCIIYSIFNKKEKISDELFTNTGIIEKSMRNKLRTISILNVIFMPLIIVFITLYNLFTHGEAFYNKPDLLISSNFTKLAQWKYRNYNEPIHQFEERMAKIDKLAKQYNEAFKNKLVNAILKFVIFVFSSIFITLIILTLINDDILINLNIIGSKNVLWFIGVIGSIIAILRTILNKKRNDSPNDLMEQISRHIIVDEKIIKNANMKIVKNEFLAYYRYKIIQIILDIVFTITMPIQLWSISYDTPYITTFLKKITNKNPQIGYICKYSDLENNPLNFFGSLINDNEKEYIKKKIIFSEELLSKEFPNWNYNKNQISAQINFL